MGEWTWWDNFRWRLTRVRCWLLGCQMEMFDCSYDTDYGWQSEGYFVCTHCAGGEHDYLPGIIPLPHGQETE